MNRQLNCLGMSLSILILLAIASQLIFVAGSNRIEEIDLQSLCEDKHNITHRSQIEALAKQLTSDEGQSDGYKCPSRIGAAIVELNKLVNDPDVKSVCSLEYIEKIRKYSDKYISTAEKETSESVNDEPEAAAAAAANIPEALKFFFIGFGMKLSGLCKMIMINTLIDHGHKLLKEEDFTRLEPLTGNQSALSEIMGKPSDYDDLYLPRDMKLVLQDSQGGDAVAVDTSDSDDERPSDNIRAADNDNNDDDESIDDDKVYLHAATGGMTKWVQTMCERRFKPIYEATILPPIYLSNMGFNYQGEELEREMKEMNENTEVHQWYRIVFLCESLADIVIIEDRNFDDATESSGQSKVVRILTKEQAAKLMKQNKSTGGDGHEEVAANAIAQVKPIVYKPELVEITHIGDEIVPPDDEQKSFNKLIKSYSTHMTELDRIERKVLLKLGSILLRAFKRGDFKTIGLLLGVGGGGGSGKQSSSTGAELVEAIDQYVKDIATGERAVAGKLSGHQLGGVARRFYYETRTSGLKGAGRKANEVYRRSTVRRTFWYSLAIVLFVGGLSAVIIRG